MQIRHISPRMLKHLLEKDTILLKFQDVSAAEAFDTWFEFRGGMEAFAEWVEDEQLRGNYLDVEIHKDTLNVDWDEEDADDTETQEES